MDLLRKVRDQYLQWKIETVEDQGENNHSDPVMQLF